MRHVSTWMFTLTNKTFNFEPQRIQGLQLPTHCIQRVTVWGALSNIGISAPTFIDGTVTSKFSSVCLGNVFVPPWCDVAFKWMKPGFNKIVFYNSFNLQNPSYATFATSICSILPWQFYQPPNAGPPLMPASIRSTLQRKLPQRNENDYSELFISILAHLFPVNFTLIVIMLLRLLKRSNNLIKYWITIKSFND
jgi:hypothetical protein